MSVVISKKYLFEAIDDAKANLSAREIKHYSNVAEEGDFDCSIENIGIDSNSNENVYSITFTLTNKFAFNIIVYESDDKNTIYNNLANEIRNNCKKLENLLNTFKTMAISNIPF